MYHLLSGLYTQYSEKPKFNILVLGIEQSGKTAWLDKVRSHVSKTGTRPLQKITPTVGQNVVNLTLPSTILHCWDLGGQRSLRSMWTRYLDDAEVLVWTMDSRDWLSAADIPSPTLQEGAFQDQMGQQSLAKVDETEAKRRREESWSVLEELVKNKHIASLPLLIMMTKIDTFSPSQVEHFRLSIHDVLERKLAGLSRGKRKIDSQDEQSHQLTNDLEDPDDAIGQWSDWHTIVCSAATGEGLNEFLEWLHTRAKRKNEYR